MEIMIPSCPFLLTYLFGKKILPEMLKLLAGVIRNPAKQCCRPISNGDLSRHGMRAGGTRLQLASPFENRHVTPRKLPAKNGS